VILLGYGNSASIQLTMSDKSNEAKATSEQVTEAKDLPQDELKNVEPENLMVNIGGKQVPFNRINKPHHVVVNRQRFQSNE